MRVHAAVATFAIGAVWGVGVRNAGADGPATPAPPAAPTAAPAAVPAAPNPAAPPPPSDPGAVANLTIERAVELAATRNERAAIADLNVVVADAAVVKARVALLPVVGVVNAAATW